MTGGTRVRPEPFSKARERQVIAKFSLQQMSAAVHESRLLANAKRLSSANRYAVPVESDIAPELVGLPRRLKEAREDAGLDRVQLDKLAGVGKGRVTRIEKGQRCKNLSAAAIVRLARVLNVRVGWLLTGESPRETGPLVIVESSPDERRIRQLIRGELDSRKPAQLPPAKRARSGKNRK